MVASLILIYFNNEIWLCGTVAGNQFIHFLRDNSTKKYVTLYFKDLCFSMFFFA